MTSRERAQTQITPRPAKIGLALGGGSALGLAHIGVIRALEERGIVPDVVAGTSMGAVIGAAYVFGVLDEVEEAAHGVNWFEVMRLLDIRLFRSGLINGDAIVNEMRRYIADAVLEDAGRPFAIVASDLANNEEVTINTGSAIDAIRASISVPGVFRPVQRNGRLLVDGGLKNPVPVSTCRAMGADRVIAVDVFGDYAGQVAAAGLVAGEKFDGGLFEMATMSVVMAVSTIAEKNAIIDPAEVTIVPKVGHIKPYDFMEAEALIKEGRAATEAVLEGGIAGLLADVTASAKSGA
ncbi:MAG: patatin-like phospholipase family protein [Alphaproteobacteria bacterium]